jgi:recombination protein RecT
MALKTPLKLLLSRWGILSLEMQTAVQLDQATVKNIDGSTYVYEDSPDEEGKMIDMPTDAELIAAFDASIPMGRMLKSWQNFSPGPPKAINPP